MPVVSGSLAIAVAPTTRRCAVPASTYPCRPKSIASGAVVKGETRPVYSCRSGLLSRVASELIGTIAKHLSRRRYCAATGCGDSLMRIDGVRQRKSPGIRAPGLLRARRLGGVGRGQENTSARGTRKLRLKAFGTVRGPEKETPGQGGEVGGFTRKRA